MASPKIKHGDFLLELADRKRVVQHKIQELEKTLRAIEYLEKLEQSTIQPELSHAKTETEGDKRDLANLERTAAILKILKENPDNWHTVSTVRGTMKRRGFKMNPKSRNEVTLTGIALKRLWERGVLLKEKRNEKNAFKIKLESENGST